MSEQTMHFKSDAESGRRGCLALGSHNTPHAGPHGAFPPDRKGRP
jgi:hypothetical protein